MTDDQRMTCQSGRTFGPVCGKPADLAVRTTAPYGKGLVTTLYQFPEDAPKTAAGYCVEHGAALVSDLARLSGGGRER